VSLRTLFALVALAAACDPDDPGGTLDGSVCGLAFDEVRAVRGGTELAVQYMKGREPALTLSVSDPESIVVGEPRSLLPPEGSISRGTGGTICALPASCDPEVSPSEITFTTLDDQAGGAVKGEFLACFDDDGLITNAHGTFDVELTLIE
jgi:hypothetical protein